MTKRTRQAEAVGSTKGKPETTETEFDASQPLENQKNEAFAQGIAAGDSATAAYTAAYPDSSPEAAGTSGGRLLKKAEVLARILYLKEQQAQKCEMDREELLKMLIDTLRSKPSEASMDNPLCELKMSKAGPYAAFMDKSRAAERIAKMLGWDAPEKIEHGGEIQHTHTMSEERRAGLMERQKKALEAARN